MVTLQGGNRAEFRFYRPQARQVFVVGDINGWNRTLTPMTRADSGEWTHITNLPQGVYQFKYLADGEWFLDYAAFGLEKGPFGWNSVLVVEPAPVRTRHSKTSAA